MRYIEEVKECLNIKTKAAGYTYTIEENQNSTKARYVINLYKGEPSPKNRELWFESPSARKLYEDVSHFLDLKTSPQPMMLTVKKHFYDKQDLWHNAMLKGDKSGRYIWKSPSRYQSLEQSYKGIVYRISEHGDKIYHINQNLESSLTRTIFTKTGYHRFTVESIKITSTHNAGNYSPCLYIWLTSEHIIDGVITQSNIGGNRTVFIPEGQKKTLNYLFSSAELVLLQLIEEHKLQDEIKGIDILSMLTKH